MQTIMRIFFALVLLFTSTLFSLAYAAIHFPEPPNNHVFYVDKANLLQPYVKNEINRTANQLWQGRNIPFFVVTIPSLITQGAIHYTIKDYATALFNSWGIGSKEKSYGILLVVSKADRNASITLGTGWGQSFDAQKLNIMKQFIVPDFDQGNFSSGILKSVTSLNAMTTGINIPKQSQLVNIISPKETITNSSWHLPLFKFALACSMVIIIFSILKHNHQHQKFSFIQNRRRVMGKRIRKNPYE